MIAPLGHGFTVPKRGGETPLLVAGGYGMAAMYLLAQRSPQKGIVFVGGRRRVDILCEKEFQALGWDVRVTTEDGSHGEKGSRHSSRCWPNLKRTHEQGSQSCSPAGQREC